MKKYIYLLFILFSLTFYSSQVKGQDVLKSQSKNVIYANLGLFPTAGINYERQLFSRDKKYYSIYYIRTCVGAFATWGSEGPYGSASLQGVWGRKSSHLELGLGLMIFIDSYNYRRYSKISEYADPFPAISAGYRYQKPKGGFVFRSGIDSRPDGYRDAYFF